MTLENTVTSKPNLLTKLKSPFALGLALLIVYAGLNSLLNIASSARSEYYAAIAKSMSLNLSNWFFGAFDPAGTVTLDKIPGSYWVPAIFVKVFGFSTWSIEVPNALAVIAAAVITVFAVRRIGGNASGLIAGLVVATTPILVAVSRSNQPQSFFVLALALTLFAATKAFKTGRRRDLVAAGLYIGLAFNFYMLEAWAVWPALIIGWLLLSPTKFEGKNIATKILDLVVAGSASILVSLFWPIIVSLIPASSRPYIGGTYHNNAFEMVFGYNGIGRFGSSSTDASYQSFTPPFSGDPSALRLFNDQLAGQIAWLLPAAVVAAVVLWFAKANRAITVMLFIWFATFAAMFSLVAGMHQFYTSALAIPVAALIGYAAAEAKRAELMWGEIALVATASVSAVIIASRFSAYFGWVSFIQILLAAVAIGLIVAKLGKLAWISAAATALALVLTPAVWASDAMNHSNSINPIAGNQSAMGGGSGGPGGGFGGPGAGFGGQNGPNGFGGPQGQMNFGGQQNGQGGMPNFGGPQGQNGQPNFGGKPNFGGQHDQGGFGGAGATSSIDQTLVEYLKANAGSMKYQVATFSSMAAAPFITSTDLSILPIGGFNGSDLVPTLDQFKALVSAGDLKYVLMDDFGGGGSGGPGGPNQSSAVSTSSEINDWVSVNCQTVDYQSAVASSTSAAPSFGGIQASLYSCSVN